MVDHFGWFGNTQVMLDYKRLAAIALLAGALYLIYLSDLRRKAEHYAQPINYLFLLTFYNSSEITYQI
ncbi:hypothetical protein KPY62_00235 [Psychrobacter sp. TAE2020]|nr:hypothetical protein [Psychrobacter sp. TAE2020]